jgi:hypothetical protein
MRPASPAATPKKDEIKQEMKNDIKVEAPT